VLPDESLDLEAQMLREAVQSMHGKAARQPLLNPTGNCSGGL
jgi:hypothetical protein